MQRSVPFVCFIISMLVDKKRAFWSLLHLQYFVIFCSPVYSIMVWFSYSECHINNASDDGIDLGKGICQTKGQSCSFY